MAKNFSIIKRSEVLFLIVFVLTMTLSATITYAQSEENVLLLDSLIEAALKNNPHLQSLHSAVLVDSVKIPQSGALPDPVLTLSMMNLPTNSFALDQEPMTGKQITLMQLFPFPGKLGLKEKISSEAEAVSDANYREYRNQLIRNVKTAYFDLFFIDKSIEITDKNRQLLQEFADIAEARYKVGRGLQQDVLKVQVEISKMIDHLIQLKQKRTVKQAALNTIINKSADNTLGKPQELEFLNFNKTLDSLQAMALIYRPLLSGWTSMRIQSSYQVDLAKKDYWPNIGIFLAYTQRNRLQNGSPGYDFVSGGLSLNIPIYSGSKQSKKVEETAYHKQMVDERYRQTLNQINFELETKRTSAEKNAELVELFKTGIIPQASQSLESALTGYQTDKVDFLTLINNQITLFNYQLEYYRVLSDYNKDLAGLEYITGFQFTNSNM